MSTYKNILLRDYVSENAPNILKYLNCVIVINYLL